VTVSTYDVTVTDRANGEVCFTATITPAPWTARDAQELAVDLARCLEPGHTVTAVGDRDEGRAET
jgi:16S rRNA G1207 methylase RsmC